MKLRMKYTYINTFFGKLSGAKVLMFLLITQYSSLITPSIAQGNYPVTTTAYFMAPFSQRLSNYFTSDKRLTVDLLLKDLTKSSIQVYLEWSIEGAGIRIHSRAGYIPPSFITLQRGIVSRQHGSDLMANYFNLDAIETEGIDLNSIYNIDIPEGFYTLHVTAFEASTGQVVSNTSENYMVLAYPPPPILNLPLVGNEIPTNPLQKIPFLWSPRHFSTANTQAVYKLRVCEVMDDMEPNEQIMLTCTEPRLEITVPQASYNGDITQYIKPLEVGKRYAWQVSVEDLSGELNNFANQGRSEVSWFRYGKECVPPPKFNIKSVGSDRVQLTWERQGDALGYVVEYSPLAPEGGLENGIKAPFGGLGAWTAISVSGTSCFIPNLNPKTTYVFRIRSDCGGRDAAPLNPSAPSDEISWSRSEAPQLSPVDELPIVLTNPWDIEVQSNADSAMALTDILDLYRPLTTASPLSPEGGTNPLDSVSLLKPPSGGQTGLVRGLVERLVIPLCAQNALNVAYACSPTHPTIPIPTGTEELTSLAVGDVLGISDFAIFITQAPSSGTTDGLGQGLMKLPFLGGKYALVEFSRLKAKKGEAGSSGGCVYEIATGGYCRVIDAERRPNASEGQTQAAYLGLLNDRLHKVDTLIFRGTLKEAITKYDSLAKIKSPHLGVRGLSIIQGSQKLLTTLESTYSNLSDPTKLVLLNSIKDSLNKYMADLEVLRGKLKAAIDNNSPIDPADIKPTDLTQKYTQLFEKVKTLQQAPLIPPTSPTHSLSNVRLINIDYNSATLDWLPSGDFDSYTITYAVENGGNITQNVTKENAKLLNLRPNTNYNFKISGIKNGEVVATYGSALFATPKRILPPPTNLAYTVQTDGSVKITWDKNREHLDYEFTYQDRNGQIRNLYPTTNSVILTELDPNFSYDYKVVARSNDGIISDIAKNIIKLLPCNIRIDADKTNIYENESVILTATCLSGTNIKWSTNENTTTITVKPAQTTTYFVSCQKMVGSTQQTCTDIIEIVVQPEMCRGFLLNASKTSIIQGETVELTAVGCSGNIQWEYGLGIGNTISSSPVDTTTYRATCIKADGGICKAQIKIDVEVTLKCNIAIVIEPTYEDASFLSLWGLLGSKKHIVVSAKCNQNDIFINGVLATDSRYKQGYWTRVLDGSTNQAVSVTCGSGRNACTKTIDVTDSPRQCKNGGFSIIQTVTPSNTLELTTTGCVEGESVKWYEYSKIIKEGPKAVISPTPDESTIYRAYCSNINKQCSAYTTYEKIVLNDFKLDYKTERYGNNILQASYCNGTVSWSSSPELNLNIDCGGNCVRLPATPTKTVTYTATCKDTKSKTQIVQRSYTVSALSKCIAVSGPTNAIMGEVINLKVEGCSGNVTWEKIGINQPLLNQIEIKDIPFNTKYEFNRSLGGGNVASYNVTCSNPKCAVTHQIQQIPCDFTATVSKQNKLKIGEEILLISSGCRTGNVKWKYDDGELIGTEDKAKIYPIEPVVIVATCEGSDCAEQKIEIYDFQITPPKSLICEDLKLIALQGATQNSYILTASGCSDGVVSWRGPGLSVNPGPTGQSIPVFVTAETTYFAECDKGWTKTQAQIKVAPVVMNIDAVPTTVENAKTTALSVTGCAGGTVTIKDQDTWTHSCISLPCKVNSAALSKTTTFTATCIVGALSFDKAVEVKVIEAFTLEALPSSLDRGITTNLSTTGCQGGTIRFSDNFGWTKTLECKTAKCQLTSNPINQNTTFTATCVRSNGTTSTKTAEVTVNTPKDCITLPIIVTPADSKLLEPYPSGSALSLSANGCSSGLNDHTISFVSKLGSIETPLISNNVTPTQSTYYKAVCYIKGVKCGESDYRLVAISQPPIANACDYFTVTATSNALEVFPSWVADKENIWFKASVSGSDGSFLIQARDCGGSIKVLFNDQDVTSSVSKGNAATGQTAPCICSMTPQDKITISCIDAAGKKCATKIITFSSGTIPQIKSGRVAAPEIVATIENVDAACTGTNPLDKLMERYFTNMICDLQNTLLENGQPSQQKAENLLASLSNAASSDPTLKQYNADFSGITASALLAALQQPDVCSPNSTAGKLLATAYKNAAPISVGDFNTQIKQSYDNVLGGLKFSNLTSIDISTLLSPSRSCSQMTLQYDRSKSKQNFSIKIPQNGTCSFDGKEIVIDKLTGINIKYNGTFLPMYETTTGKVVGFYRKDKYETQPSTSCGRAAYNIKDKTKPACAEFFIPIKGWENSELIKAFISYYAGKENDPLYPKIIELIEKLEPLGLLAQDKDTPFLDNGLQSLYDALNAGYEATNKNLDLLKTLIDKPDRCAVLQAFWTINRYKVAVSGPGILTGLPLTYRKKALKLLAEGNLTGANIDIFWCKGGVNGGEESVLKLLTTTPENERKEVLDYVASIKTTNDSSPLYAFMVNLDGSSFDDYMTIIINWTHQYYPSTETWDKLLERTGKEKDDVLLLGRFTDGYKLGGGSNSSKTYLNFGITQNLSTPLKTLSRSVSNAFEDVLVKFEDDYTLGNTSYKKGVVYKIPALQCYLIMNDMKRTARATTLKYTLYGLGALVGVSEIAAAQTTLDASIALIDMAVLSTDFAINETLATKLNQTAEGRNFLDKWNKFTLIYGGARAYVELTGLAKEMRRSATALNDNEVNELTTQISVKAVKSTGVLDNAFVAGWDEAKVLAMKPRPPVSTYINPAFEAQHLAKFQGKAYRFTLESPLNQFGMIGRNDGAFILSELDKNALLLATGGDVSKLETALGITDLAWQKAIRDGDKLLLIEINDPQLLNLRMSVGNESAANRLWIPGGYTPDGYSEAVIDFIPINRIDLYTKITIAQ